MEKAVLKQIFESGDCCEDLLRQAGIFVRCRDDMPVGVPALTIYDEENGYYNVYLNSKMSYERNLISLCHEILEHIGCDHWHSNLQIDKIEFAARKGAGQL